MTPAAGQQPAGFVPRGETRPGGAVGRRGDPPGGDGGSGGIQRTLGAARSGFGQAFTTGPTAGGYALGSLGIQVSQFSDGSTAGDDLRVTVNGVADGGGPGDALCALTHPSSFQAPGVSTFGAPAGEDACPQLAEETSYFAVIEWVEPDAAGRLAVIPQTFPTDESAASDEDAGGADGWSIADVSWYLAVASGVRTWTAYATTASFKIRLKEAADAAIVANRPATGLPTVSGTARVGETLTASVSAIADADGRDNAVFSHQWIRTGATGTATDIAGATDSAYALADADAGATIAVRVTFEDDGGTRETLVSAAPEEDDATLDFAVTLDPAADAAVTVDYATSDDGETLALTLSNAAGAGIDRAAATGTIRDDDALPVLTASFAGRAFGDAGLLALAGRTGLRCLARGRLSEPVERIEQAFTVSATGVDARQGRDPACRGSVRSTRARTLKGDRPSQERSADQSVLDRRRRAFVYQLGWACLEGNARCLEGGKAR